MRKTAAVLFALALTPHAMAQTPPPATIADVGSPVLAPVATEFGAEPQTATGPAILLTQQANVIGVVRVDAPVAGSIPFGAASISLSLAPGAQLFPVVLQQRRDVRLFCTPETTANVYNPLRPPLITRTCLADTNGDLVFDFLGYMQVNVTSTRSVSGAWETPPAPHIGGGAVTLATGGIASPVPFTPLQQHAIAPVTLALTARIVGETAVVDLRSPEEGASLPISDRRDVVAKADMPHIVALHGAQVELQSLDNGALTYRVISGFAADRPLAFLAAPRR